MQIILSDTEMKMPFSDGFSHYYYYSDPPASLKVKA